MLLIYKRKSRKYMKYTWLWQMEHMLKRVISVQSNSDGRIIGPWGEEKKGHVHYIHTGPCTTTVLDPHILNLLC
uniref:Uncharacterized protein n=1 Tax=Oryza brachyantha TaxID=4533 RepID=J3LHK8_ORYBR